MIHATVAGDSSRLQPAGFPGSRATLRLMEIDGASPEALAVALAQDALAVSPSVERVIVQLFDIRFEMCRGGVHDGKGMFELPIRAALGRAGTLSLFPRSGETLAPGDHLPATALSWLAANAIDRQRLQFAEGESRIARSRLEATFAHAPVGIAHVAPDGRFLQVNERFATITDRSREDLLAHGFQYITHPEDLASDIAHVNRLLSGEAERYMMEKRYLRPDGSSVWVNLTVALVRDSAGDPDFFVSVIEDMSEVKRAWSEATLDPLTGLLNRRGLMELLPRELARCEAAGLPLTLLYLDLDGFKKVNDQLGHGRGDQCLAAASHALLNGVGSQGEIARIGGDEFVMVLAGVEAKAAPEWMTHLAASLGTTEIAPGWPVSGSFGSATALPGRPVTAQRLIAKADEAMFRGKRERADK